MTNSPVDAAKVQAARERFESALQRYALRQLGDKAESGKEILASVWKNFQEQPAGEVAGDQEGEWLFRNCRRRILAMQGKGQAKRVDTGESAQDPGTTIAPMGTEDGEEPYVTMQRLVERLTPKQQEALRLRFQNDFSVQQISAITELTPYNVGVLVHNAMARLDREYRAQHPEENGVEKKGIGDDARLTLYALGEMEDAERKSFEDSLIDTKNAAVRVEEIRAVGALIGQTLAIEAGAPAPHTVRKRKRSGLALWLAFPRVLLPLTGVVVAGVLVFLWLGKSEAVSGTAREKIDFRLKPADWKEGDPLPDEAPDKIGRSAGSGLDSPSIRPAAKSGAQSSPRLPARAKPAESAAPSAARREARAELAGVGETPAIETSEADENESPSGGVPMGAVPTGVAAVQRGKSGDERAMANPTSLREGHETASFAEFSPDKLKGGDASPDGKKAGEVKADGRMEGSSKQKVAPSTQKNKTERKERVFALAKDAGVSKLSPDVGASSVGALKKTLASGRRPNPKSIKVEELLNYYPLPGAEPEGDELFATTLEASEAPWDAQKRLVRISVKGKAAPTPLRGAASLVLLVDISGSMVEPNRLPLVKEAVRLLLARLRPDDRVGVVTYAAEPRLALLPTPVEERQEILRVIEQLEAKGPTNGAAGMELAYDLAKAHGVPGGRNFVIMCTDGDFNSGPTREEELAKIIDRQKDAGVTLSIYGFGRGRQIDARLEKLAMRGGGASGYVNTRREAERVLTGEINGIFSPLAKDLDVKVVFNPTQVEGYRLLGYDVPTDVAAKRAPEAPESKTVLPGHTFTALYEIIPAPGVNGSSTVDDLLKVELNYQTPRDGAAHRQEFSLRDRGRSFGEASLDFKFSAAVGAFGMVLSEQAPEGMTLNTVEQWAKDCLGEDVGGYRSEFLALVEQARAMEE